MFMTRKPRLLARSGTSRTMRRALKSADFGSTPHSRRVAVRKADPRYAPSEEGDFAVLSAVARACHFENPEDLVASVKYAYSIGPRTIAQTPVEVQMVLSTATSTVIEHLAIVDVTQVIIQAHADAQAAFTPFIDIGIDGAGANDNTVIRLEIVGLDDTVYPHIINSQEGARIPILGAMGSSFKMNITAPSATAGNPVNVLFGGLQGRPESFPMFTNKSLLDAYVNGGL